MEISFISPVVAAFGTLLVGFVWYHPKVFGTIWMKEIKLTEDEMQKSSMFKLFGLTFIFSILIAMVMQMLTIHQIGAIGMVGGPDKLAEAKPSFAAFMADYGTAFRTAKHGALHGFMTGLFFVFPIIAIDSLFEKKSWKYIFIQTGYWVVSLALIGAVVCAWV